VDAAVAEEIYVRRVRGEAIPSDSAGLEALRQDLIETLIDRRIVIAKAERESIEVTATEVEDGLDEWLAGLIKASGSEAAFSQELARQGFTIDDLRFRYRKDIEEQLVVSKFMRQQFGAITVSENDLARFFEAKYDSIPSLPEVVALSHIIVSPQIAPSREAEVAAKVERLLARLRRGEAFDQVAREASDDPVTRATGGDIGTVAPGDLGPEIAAVAAELAAGQFSEPFRSGHGIEILKMEAKIGGNYKMRHIFVAFAPDAADTARAMRLAEDIRSRLVSGEAFEGLAREYSEDAGTKESGGYLGEIEAGGLDPIYRDAVAALNPGDISQVIRTPRGFQVLKLVSRTAARKPSYEEAKSWIANLIETRRREAEFAKWLDAARQDIYVKKLP